MLISSKINEGIKGSPKIPGDKSISHRSIIISSISNGKTEIKNILMSEDVMRTLDALKSMGVKIELNSKDVLVHGNGLLSLKKPEKEIDLGNSGTTARLLIGLLSAQNFNSYLFGDKSLSRRPMARIIDPVTTMGAKIKSNKKLLPITITGSNLIPIKYELNVPSAQVKSGIALASLFLDGKTEIIEKFRTRNHTELMLENFEADIKITENSEKKHILINGRKELIPKTINISNDISSAAFFIVAALINEKSDLELKNININPTRIGIINTLKKMGANILIKNKKNINGEDVADIFVKYSILNGCETNKDEAILMIDEFPILAIAASFANSPSIFRGLSELRIKESNRLKLIRDNLCICGIYSEINGDDLLIDPLKKISVKSNIIETNSDHRIAMSFLILGSKLGTDLNIKEAEFINTSFPFFKDIFNSVGGKLFE
ncbi:MAG: 3-phosphoshikimate 1-carboxyvinyltransferase [Alphaproteobacteria bacterium MarineAlpha5_Bin9]|nr:MAG: 3-phosphoshikimate 1-carboxyvinyltransferase [Alphaproteobacteria bacterium MarineAlpha5_Bin9]|tara:strand:- start:1275 stop:2582 length:1308 start_codon:yes stop_codon:yes gene_type:complete